VKRCSRCGLVKALDRFHRDQTRRPSGRTSRCAECRNAVRRVPGGPGPWRRLPDDDDRRCRECAAVLPAAAFAVLASGRRRGTCRACRNDAANARRRAARAAARTTLAEAA
jgi:hypothetical protein